MDNLISNSTSAYVERKSEEYVTNYKKLKAIFYEAANVKMALNCGRYTTGFTNSVITLVHNGLKLKLETSAIENQLKFGYLPCLTQDNIDVFDSLPAIDKENKILIQNFIKEIFSISQENDLDKIEELTTKLVAHKIEYKNNKNMAKLFDRLFDIFKYLLEYKEAHDKKMLGAGDFKLIDLSDELHCFLPQKLTSLKGQTIINRLAYYKGSKQKDLDLFIKEFSSYSEELREAAEFIYTALEKEKPGFGQKLLNSLSSILNNLQVFSDIDIEQIYIPPFKKGDLIFTPFINQRMINDITYELLTKNSTPKIDNSVDEKKATVSQSKKKKKNKKKTATSTDLQTSPQPETPVNIDGKEEVTIPPTNDPQTVIPTAVETPKTKAIASKPIVVAPAQPLKKIVTRWSSDFRKWIRKLDPQEYNLAITYIQAFSRGEKKAKQLDTNLYELRVRGYELRLYFIYETADKIFFQRGSTKDQQTRTIDYLS